MIAPIDASPNLPFILGAPLWHFMTLTRENTIHYDHYALIINRILI